MVSRAADGFRVAGGGGRGGCTKHLLLAVEKNACSGNKYGIKMDGM